MSQPSTFHRRVPQARVNAYLNAGWSLPDILGKADLSGNVPMRRTIMTLAQAANHYSDQKSPYLVQRATIKRPLGAYHKARLSEAVEYDYMGSAEFEFGAVAVAVRQFQAFFPLCELYVCEELSEYHDDRKFNLRIFGNFDSPEQYQEYVECLKDLKREPFRAKENPRFKLSFYTSNQPDVWFDIENSVIFSFDKQFMNRVATHLQASFAHMDKELA